LTQSGSLRSIPIHFGVDLGNTGTLMLDREFAGRENCSLDEVILVVDGQCVIEKVANISMSGGVAHSSLLLA
jgi:hypothetical protein